MTWTLNETMITYRNKRYQVIQGEYTLSTSGGIVSLDMEGPA